jgi:hypothetical protein
VNKVQAALIFMTRFLQSWNNSFSHNMSVDFLLCSKEREKANSALYCIFQSSVQRSYLLVHSSSCVGDMSDLPPALPSHSEDCSPTLCT